jgi:hypothetical protein
MTVNQAVRLAGDLMLLDATGRSTGSMMRVPLLLHFPPFPLEPATSIALSRDRIYIGTQDSAFVDAYGLDGKLIRSVPVGVPPRPASAEHFARAVDALVYSVPQAEFREDVRRQILATVSQPAMLPPYGPLFADPDGFLWIQTSFPGDSLTTLRAIGGTGGESVDIRLPRSVTVLEIGSDYLLATYEAATGEPCIAMYSLHRTGR